MVVQNLRKRSKNNIIKRIEQAEAVLVELDELVEEITDNSDNCNEFERAAATFLKEGAVNAQKFLLEEIKKMSK